MIPFSHRVICEAARFCPVKLDIAAVNLRADRNFCCGPRTRLHRDIQPMRARAAVSAMFPIPTRIRGRINQPAQRPSSPCCAVCRWPRWLSPGFAGCRITNAVPTATALRAGSLPQRTDVPSRLPHTARRVRLASFST